MSTHMVMTHAPTQEESASILALRDALTDASATRRATEADMRAHVPGAYDAHRVADRAEMDAYLALHDARHAMSAPVQGVSLAKSTDYTPTLCAGILSGHGCAHTAIMDESGVQVACGRIPRPSLATALTSHTMHGLSLNDPNALGFAFAWLARFPS